MAESTPRVNREDAKSEIIEKYLDKDGPFTEIRQVLTFAASLGFSRGVRMPLSGKKGEGVRWDTFTGQPGAESLVQMIALVSSEDREIVAPERLNEQLEIFQEYANGGLQIMHEELQSSSRHCREVVRDLVAHQAQSEAATEIDPLGIGL